jgi:hypothetical protein
MLMSLNPDVILLQETMCKGEEVIKVISPWLKYWAFSAVEVEGMSDGLLDRLESEF